MRRVELFVHYLINENRKKYTKEVYVHDNEVFEKKKKVNIKKLTFTKKWFTDNFEQIEEKYGIVRKFGLENIKPGDIYSRYLVAKNTNKTEFNVNLYDILQMEFEIQKLPKRLVLLDK